MDDQRSIPAETAEPPRIGQTFKPELNARGAARRRRFIAFGAILVLCAIGAGLYWTLTRGFEHTDDAFVDGDTVDISPQISGRVLAIHFADNQRVKRGALLIEIDPRRFAAALDAARAGAAAAAARLASAQANLDLTRTTAGAGQSQATSELARAQRLAAASRDQIDEARAQALRAKQDAARARDLFAQHVVSRQSLDLALAEAQATEARWHAAQRSAAAGRSSVNTATAQLDQASTVPQQVALRQAELDQAKAELDRAQAEVALAQLELGNTRIIAPHDGIVAKRSVNPGDIVQPNQFLGRLVIGAPWITANFKETQITAMRPGQPVSITIDAYPGETFAGYVDSLEAGTGTRFALLPPENATGNFVKVLQRVPVKIVFDNPNDIDQYLSLGMSAVPTVDTNQSAAPVVERIEPPAAVEELPR